MAEQLAVFAEDSDVEVGDEDDDSSSFVCSSHADVVQFGSVAQGEDACRVDFVVAAAAAEMFGRGGKTAVATASGMSRNTVIKAETEVAGRDRAV